MSNPKWEEMIVVAPRKAVFGENDELAKQGVIIDGEARKIINNLAESTTIMRRGGKEEAPMFSAEANPEYKQPIPYCVVTSDDNDIDGIRVFGYRRLEGGGESRLHGKISIGIGGHMNEAFGPHNVVGVLMEEAYREAQEELIFDSVEGAPDITKYPFSIVGVINDDADEVGRVHLGILCTIDTPPAHSVEVRETDQLDGDWYTLEELEELRDQLEGWSAYALDALKQVHA